MENTQPTSPHPTDPHIDSILPKPPPVKRNWWITATVIFALLFIFMTYQHYTYRANYNIAKTLENAFDETKEVTPTSEPDQQEDVLLPENIQSFPVYPNATFVKKQVVPLCEGEVPGYTYCDETLYIWSTPDDGDIVQSWYQNDTAKSGWVCGKGGAGQYSSSRDFDSWSTCKMDANVYGFTLNATAKETTITLGIRNK